VAGKRDRLFGYSGADGEILEERGAESVLPAGEEAADAEAGRGCDCVAAKARQGVSDAGECIVAGGDVGGRSGEG